MKERLRRLGPNGIRRLLIGVGLFILLAIAGLMYIRDVERVEVLGTLLFIPIFLAFINWGLKGGLIAGVLGAIAYALLRVPAIEAVGAGRFVGLIASRALGLLAFGAIGGTANDALEASLVKLELYDQIDDATGLFNARFFLQDTDLELSRSKRYKTIFSITAVDFPNTLFASLSRRHRENTVKELGRVLGDSVRTVDRAVHGTDGKRHRLAVVMPETGPEGARIFTDRLQIKVTEWFQEKGFPVGPRDVVARSVTFPEAGEPEVQRMRAEFAVIDKIEHPEGVKAAVLASTTAKPPAASPPPTGGPTTTPGPSTPPTTTQDPTTPPTDPPPTA
ncbi:MAG: hypothetical protein QOG16_884 [Actinomycetota bacterium]|jgi:GGDEF domain-containing protein|nr:hypothetical protein [Actinomycetota bacterium]